MREELLDGDCVTAGWGTHSLGSLIPGRFILIIFVNNFQKKDKLQAFAKSSGTTDGKR